MEIKRRKILSNDLGPPHAYTPYTYTLPHTDTHDGTLAMTVTGHSQYEEQPGCVSTDAWRD